MQHLPVFITLLICGMFLLVLRIKLDVALIRAIGEEALSPLPTPAGWARTRMHWVYQMTQAATIVWRRCVRDAVALVERFDIGNRVAIASQVMMMDILRQLPSACFVVESDLTVLHANAAATDLFARQERKGFPLEFHDLPQALRSKVFEVLKTGLEIRHFKYALIPEEKRFYRVTITPFQKASACNPSAALVLVEDCTDEEKLHTLELEAANLRLVKTMAERLSHEVGNALVPLSIHQQLFAEKQDDPEFRESLKVALEDGVKRVFRLARQMSYLASDLPSRIEAISLEQLIQDAFKDARRHQPQAEPLLNYEQGSDVPVLHGDRASLKYALCEILLNAIQTNAKQSKVSVRLSKHADEEGLNWVEIEIKDNGPGFTVQSAECAAQAFFTTRTGGLGLGLTACRKIVEMHKGRLEIEPSKEAPAGIVRIALPLSPALDQ